MLKKILKLGQQRGNFRKIDRSLAGAMVIDTVMQTIFCLKNGRIAVNYDNVVEEVVQTILKMVQT